MNCESSALLFKLQSLICKSLSSRVSKWFLAGEISIKYIICCCSHHYFMVCWLSGHVITPSCCGQVISIIINKLYKTTLAEMASRYLDWLLFLHYVKLWEVCVWKIMNTWEEHWQESVISFGESRPEPEAGQEESSQRQTEYSAVKPCSEQEEASWSLIYI